MNADYAELVDQYVAGPRRLREAVEGMTTGQLDARPIPGKWSTRQVVCHIADFEPIYVDRMKRAIAEQQPTVFGGDPDIFAAHLVYDQRDVEEELQLIASVRNHMARILRSVDESAFQREVDHAEHGLMTVQQMLTLVTRHIPHHIKFIEEKRAAL